MSSESGDCASSYHGTGPLPLATFGRPAEVSKAVNVSWLRIKVVSRISVLSESIFWEGVFLVKWKNLASAAWLVTERKSLANIVRLRHQVLQLSKTFLFNKYIGGSEYE